MVTSSDSLEMVDWRRRILCASPDVPTLLHRHYLVAYSIKEEIQPTLNSLSLYRIIGSMLGNTIRYDPSLPISLWEGIDDDIQPINVFRQRQSAILTYVNGLANQDDTTDHQLDHHHGLLSSLSLIYGLYLVRVILTYELAVRFDLSLDSILRSISDTLTKLKGVFNHVEVRYASSHVR